MKATLHWNADFRTTYAYIQYSARIPNVWYVLFDHTWYKQGESR